MDCHQNVELWTIMEETALLRACWREEYLNLVVNEIIGWSNSLFYDGKKFMSGPVFVSYLKKHAWKKHLFIKVFMFSVIDVIKFLNNQRHITQTYLTYCLNRFWRMYTFFSMKIESTISRLEVYNTKYIFKYLAFFYSHQIFKICEISMFTIIKY